MPNFHLTAFALALLATAFAIGTPPSPTPQAPVARGIAVRYQVTNVARSVTFYTEGLGFKLNQPQVPAFASVSLSGLTLWLSGPGSSGSRPLPDGRKQKPGGWNRIAIEVDDLSGAIKRLKSAGYRFRNQMEVGPGGKQIQIEDPDGNPVELFEPARKE
ncbi:MAG: VOC family protein [Fimbriimonas sp.]